MKKRKKIFLFLICVIAAGFLIPQNLKMPVQGAYKSDYHKDSFWFYPWGKSGTHKGVDVFAKTGTPVSSSTAGIVVYNGNISMGGNVVLILGPKWRFHYYAHLNTISCDRYDLVSQSMQIGTVGSSGNAKGKPAHLHYSISSFFPLFWRIDSTPQGWKKMFYLNPIDYF